MERILFILGVPSLEAAICDKLTKENFQYQAVGSLIDGRNILGKVNETSPTIIILRDDDKFWASKKDIIPTVNQIIQYSKVDVRIIFLAKNRPIGDQLLSQLVMYGVKDILRGETLKLDDIINSIKHPASNKDANIYLPKPKGHDVDQLLFETEDGENKNTSPMPNNVGININIVRKGAATERLTDVDMEEDEGLDEDNLEEQVEPEAPLKDLLKKASPQNLLEKFSIFGGLKKQPGNQDETTEDKAISNPIVEPVARGEVRQESVAAPEPVIQYEQTDPVPVRQQQPDPAPIPEPQPQQAPEPKPRKTSLLSDVLQQKRQPSENMRPVSNEEDSQPNIAEIELERMKRMLEEKERELQKIQKEIKEETVGERRKGQNDSQKIITFYSNVNGTGSTLSAFSVACRLAHFNKKVLFLEVDDKKPSLPYWYDMGYDKWGLDVCLAGFETKNYKQIEKSIITKTELIEEQLDVSVTNYKIMPNNLDYLFFSKDYVRIKNKAPINSNTFSDLLVFLLHTYRYDYIIVDVSSSMDQNIVEAALIHSHKNVIVLTQDVSIVSQNLKFLTELSKRGIVFNIGKTQENLIKSDKNVYLINRFNKRVKFTPEILQEWFELPDLSSIVPIPDNLEDIMNSIYDGRIPLDESRDKTFKKSIEYLSSKLIK